MDDRERGSHARDASPTQYTSRMDEARGRNRHMNNARVVRNMEERIVRGKVASKT